MKWIYLSPHLDDVVFSCGGLVWEQTQAGDQVEIWTIFAGDPPGGALPLFAQLLHRVWDAGDNPVPERRVEDRAACRKLGAKPVHFSVPDCIYRRAPEDGSPLYPGEEAIFGGWDPAEQTLIDDILGWFRENLPEQARVVSPLGIGNHVDHALTRQAAQRLERELWYYADYPYAREEIGQESLRVLAASDDWEKIPHALSGPGLVAWQEAAASYASQISSFWESVEALHRELAEYAHSMNGVRLWQRTD
jgi:LmbE family N-acetylglucosaminyl deacetylase